MLGINLMRVLGFRIRTRIPQEGEIWKCFNKTIQRNCHWLINHCNYVNLMHLHKLATEDWRREIKGISQQSYQLSQGGKISRRINPAFARNLQNKGCWWAGGISRRLTHQYRLTRENQVLYILISICFP